MAECPHDPKAMEGKPIGMYHCPMCSCMVLACMDHTPHEEDCPFEPKANYEEEWGGNAQAG